METWFLILISLSIASLLKSIISFFFPSNNNPTISLPPRPLSLFTTILWVHKPIGELEPILRSLHAKFGPIISLQIGRRLDIYVADRNLAHHALIQNGAVLADRPPPLNTTKIISNNQHNINSAFYGPKWRLFSRNLVSQVLHPSRVRSYSKARKWALQILLDRLESQSNYIHGNFVHALYCLLFIMCFGDKLSEREIEEIERVHRSTFLKSRSPRFNILNVLWLKLSKIVFRKRWSEFLQLQKNVDDLLIPVIRERIKLVKEFRLRNENNGFLLSYVDTLFDLQLPEEKRKLSEKEIISLCDEFINGGIGTTATALQWIMANLVKYPNIQEKLFMEIKRVVGDEVKEEIKEEDLQKMKYLKAVILEGLRRHPPGHFLLPHAVTEDVILGKYLVPKNGTINFLLPNIGWDPTVWEDPMAFKPERFMEKGDGGGGGGGDDKHVFNIVKGIKEIKMMPFGVGRRMCPGYGLALLHLEYFVANLIWNFEWKAVDDDDDVDFSEQQVVSTVMKNPLKANISPRFKNK